MTPTEQAQHRAVQYIAAVGISYGQEQEDDGHTTLAWYSDRAAMAALEVVDAEDIRFALNVLDHSLQCWDQDGHTIGDLGLDGSDHQQVMEWMRYHLKSHGADPEVLKYDFHYHLDVHEERGAFPSPDEKELVDLARIRTLADTALHDALGEHRHDPIRIWPHHFDTGSQVVVAETDAGERTGTIGVGLAVPDEIMPVHYLYASPWSKEGDARMTDLPELTIGEWRSGDFNGAVCAAHHLTALEMRAHLNEAITALLPRVRS